MSGIDRLRALAGAWDEWGLGGTLADVADQIERELREDAAWVREHGGLAEVEKEWNVRSNLKRSLETAQAKVERQQRHIEFAQGKCHERLERIAALNKTVAEMRQRLMPEGMEWLVEAWPRFEDDAPLRIGDEGLDAYGRAHRAERVTLSEGGHVDVCDESGDVWWSNTRRDEHDDVMLDLGKRIKRPAPKVLDADGVEIELGDELYGCESGRGPFRVSGVLSDSAEVKLMSYLDGSEFMTCAATFTHRAPALASDGKPLREGETVWGTNGGSYHLTSVHDGKVFARHVGDSFGAEVESAGGEGLYRLRADQLTHECPVADTWERLEEDAGCTATKYNERRGTIFTTKQQVARDLVRRAKKLAERGR